MQNYKKISLLLLLSTAITVNATDFNPYDPSGKPDFGDFDDQSGGPLPTSSSRDYGKTALEREAEKQNQTPTQRPTAQPIPVPQPAKKNPNLYKQHEIEKKQREEAVRKLAETKQEADKLTSLFYNLCNQVEQRNGFLRAKMEALTKEETNYTTALEELSEQRNLGFYEKIGVGIFAIAAVGALLTENMERVPAYLGTAIVSAGATAWSCIPRRRSCNKEEQALTTAHQAALEDAAARTRSYEAFFPSKPNDQLIQEADATLATLRTMPLVVSGDFIAKLEAILSKLKAQTK